MKFKQSLIVKNSYKQRYNKLCNKMKHYFKKVNNLHKNYLICNQKINKDLQIILIYSQKLFKDYNKNKKKNKVYKKLIIFQEIENLNHNNKVNRRKQMLFKLNKNKLINNNNFYHNSNKTIYQLTLYNS